MKNKWVRMIVTILLGAFVANIGNMIGGVIGNIITIFGGVAIIYGVVEAFKKQKAPQSREPKQSFAGTSIMHYSCSGQTATGSNA
jgi:hypothetical protein